MTEFLVARRPKDCRLLSPVSVGLEENRGHMHTQLSGMVRNSGALFGQALDQAVDGCGGLIAKDC